MKPIAVLLLVLVAVGALIFGLVTLGGGKEPTVTVTPEQPAQPTHTPTKTAEIEKGSEAPVRQATPAPKVERTNVEDAWVFANELKVLVLDPQKRPLPEVEVTLTTFNSSDLFFVDDHRAPFQVGPQRTDKEGRTSFKNLPPRKYTLVCIHPDYARREQETMPIDQDGTFEEPAVVMATGSTMQGYVRDEQNNPVPDAVMVLEGMLAQAQKSAAPDRVQVKTNAEGFYKFKNIPRSTGRSLTISAKGYGRLVSMGLAFDRNEQKNQDYILKTAEMIQVKTIGPGNQPIPKVKVMAVGMNASQQTARDEGMTDDKGEFLFESLAPGEYNVVANLRGWRFQSQRIKTGTANNIFEGQKEASICGQVVDGTTGAPVSQFSCQIRNFTDPTLPTYAVPETRMNFTDAQGNFCLEGVQQGEYVVEGWAEGFAPSRSQNFVVTQGRNVEHVTVRLTKGGSISGRLVDPENHPIAKARIQTKPNDWADDDFTRSIEDMYPSNVTQVEARSAADGTFTLNNLTPDTYQILVDATGFTRVSKVDVAVTEGTNNNLSDLRLTRGGTLAGTVYDATGKGVLGAGILVVSADNLPLPRQYSTKSGIDGKYTLRNLAPGRYKVRAARPSAPDSNPLEELQIGRDSERQITIAEDTVSNLDLTIQASPPAPAPTAEEVVPMDNPPQAQPRDSRKKP